MAKKKGVDWLSYFSERELLNLDKRVAKMTDGKLDIAILDAFPGSPYQKRLWEIRRKRKGY